MTVTDLMGLMKAHLDGDLVATQALADVYEESGDYETGHELRHGIRWMRFETEESKGGIGVGRGSYGPQIYAENVQEGKYPVGILDLFPNSDGKTSFVFDDSRYDDWMVRLLYDRQGHLEVVVNQIMIHQRTQDVFIGEHIFSLPDLPEEE